MPVSIDFETFFSTKLKYGLKQMIAEEYVQHERFDCYLVSVCDGKNVWAGHPRDLNWNALAGQVWLSHNRYFDNTVYNELVRRNLAPKIERADWHCTANLTSYLCNRRALKDAVQHLYKGVSISKDYRTVADNKSWPNDYTPEEREQVMESGRVDAHWCWRLWNDFSAQWPEWERKLSNLTIDQGMYGVAVDQERLSDYIVQAHEMRATTEQAIPWIAGSGDEEWDDFNTKPTSTKCIAEQCRRTRIPCPPTKSDDEEGYEAWEAQFGPTNPWISAVSAWRSINKFYATLQTLRRRLRPDGTVPFALKYFGGHTGRWSGDAKVNFQNMRRKPIFCNEFGLMEMDDIKIDKAIDHHDDCGKWPEWVQHALDFRALVVPRPGKKMIICDLAQIEPRVLAWLGGNHKLLKMIADGMGIYEAFARSQMKYDGAPFSKETKRTDYYKMVKINLLGLGYGAGWEKFITIAKTQGGLDITKEDPEFVQEPDPVSTAIRTVPGYGAHSKQVVKAFRENNPHITGMWKLLDNSLKGSVGSDFKMRLPSGRVMKYNDVRLSSRVVKDKKTGKPVNKTEVTVDVGGRRVATYGGKLTENITQAVARDVFGMHLVQMTDAGLRCLFTSHDEAIMEVDPSVTARDIEQHMSQCPDWLPGCPIAAEAQEVAHYQK
jgi:DNA polymerase